MEIGKKYKMLGHEYYYPELQPGGTIVRCIEDKGNGFFIIELIDKCNKKIEKDIGGWLINIIKNKKYYKLYSP